MNQLGGHLLERHLCSAPSAVCWQSTEVSTGLNNLLFICTPAQTRQAQQAPHHPALLTAGAWATADTPEGPVAYAAAALPAGSAPLAQPTPAQVGQVLEGLQALHAAGRAHGGIAPQLLWQVGGEAKLAGAGVPWQAGAQPSADEDLRALAQALRATQASVPTQWLEWLASAPTSCTASHAAQRLSSLTAAPLPGLTAPPAAAQDRAKAPPHPAPTSTAPTLPKAQPGAWEQPAASAARPRTARRLSPWPWLITALALGAVLCGSYWAYENLQVPQAPTAQTQCCQVRYAVRGAADIAMRAQVLDWPATLKLDPAEAETQVPGSMQLPGPGRYQVRIFADGYTPQTIEVNVPRTTPITIELEE